MALVLLIAEPDASIIENRFLRLAVSAAVLRIELLEDASEPYSKKRSVTVFEDAS